MRQREERRAVGLLGALWLAGCATAPVPEPSRPFLPYQLAPPGRALARPAAAEPAPPLRAPVTLSDPPIPPASREINGALLRFAIDQRNSRAMAAPLSPVPDEVRASWAALLAAVDRFLGWPPASTLPLDAVRARVAVDSELDMDRSHWGSLPAGLEPSVRARALALEARIAVVRRLAQPARPAAAPFTWPLEPVIITSLFGDRADPFSGEGETHLGVDLKAEPGQLVRSAAGGVVLRAGPAGGHGLHVEVRHPSGDVTGYSHLSLLLVSVGMHVPAHGPLGLAGSTGRSTGPHLHFEVWKDGGPVDPLGELPDPGERELGSQNIGSGE